MKRLMVASAIMLVGFLFLSAQAATTTGIVADDPDDDTVAFSENEIRKIARADVKGGLYSSGVEYFRDAHQRILVAQAQEAGFTKSEAKALVAEAVAKFKAGGVPAGIQALTDFYVSLDEKRSERDAKLVERIKKLEDQVAELKLQTPAPAATPEEDPVAIAKAADLKASQALDVANQAKKKVDDFEAKWHDSLKEVNEKLDSLEKEVKPSQREERFFFFLPSARMVPLVRRAHQDCR
ncbi:MAG: hypothetical protein PHU56_04310 [Candidatus Pacebacteria bacterium]|nr:hypothetical protein [Candidatus Paceibacterota bacterium]